MREDGGLGKRESTRQDFLRNSILDRIRLVEYLNESPLHDEDYADDDHSDGVTSLLEENARLRALVVRLTGLVLKSVADLCRAAKRDSDIVARVGGEEFAIMLPETTEDATMQFAERLRRLARDCALAANGEEIPVTISVGIAGASMRTAGIESLMRDADYALYQAKRSGRDQIVVARHDDPTEMQEAAE